MTSVGSLALLSIVASFGPSVTAAVAAARHEPRPCTSEAIGADTGVTIRPDIVCSAGFAMAVAVPDDPRSDEPAETTAAPLGSCDRPADCSEVEIFHATTSRWVHDGRHDRTCADDLGVAFMSPHTAATFAPVCAQALPEPVTVAPGDAGVAVMYVQIALVALGADVAIDGTYDPAMEREVRRTQTAHGVDPSGVVGPETHAILGTGPSVAAPSDIVPGRPRPCTVAAIAADTGLPVEFVSGDCRAGWALGVLSTTCPPAPDDPDAECETADVFHVEGDGWVYSGGYHPSCAEALAVSGMSIHTALGWSPVCGDVPVPDRSSITPGSRGPAVRQLQIALVALGYPIEVDGAYGSSTEAALRDFQRRTGLEVDGVAGADTQAALGM